MPPDLIVHYGKAPVAEAVLGVQFAQSAIDLDVLAEFSRGLREAFPRREQHEPLMPTKEELTAGGAPVTIEFQVVQEFPFPRTWFVSEDGHRLIQLQADRLVFNWRKLEDDEEYPHYDGLRPIFEENLRRLRECFDALGRPQPTANLTEVSYVNFVAVPISESGAGHAGLHRLLRDICPPQEGSFLPAPEDQAYIARYRIPHWASPEETAGRLHVSAQPAYRNRDRMPIYTVKLTTNLVPAFPDDETILRALDWGREWAVRTFDLIAQPEMQEAWGREEVET